MKTIITVALIFGISIGLLAQNLKTSTLFQKKEFKELKNKDTADYFSISPLFKTDTSALKLNPFPKLPDDINNGNGSTNPFMAENRVSELRMPVLGVSPSFNMPVFVPDSSARYYILEKRISIYNPLEKKYK